MNQSLKDQLKTYFQSRKDTWINSGEVERFVMTVKNPKSGAFYKVSNGERRLREAESGRLSDGKPCEKFLVKEIRNGSVWYKYLGKEKIVSSYEVVDGRAILTQTKIFA